MAAPCKFCVIQFKDQPGQNVPDRVIVPTSWIVSRRPPSVAYPNENFDETNRRARTEEPYSPDWDYFRIRCLYGCDTWEAAFSYLTSSLAQDNSNAPSNNITSENITAQDNSNAPSNNITSENITAQESGGHLDTTQAGTSRNTATHTTQRQIYRDGRASRKSVIEILADITKQRTPQMQTISKNNIVRHPKIKEGLMELLPHSEVYTSTNLLSKILIVRKSCKYWVPIVMQEVFTVEALKKYNFNDLKKSHELMTVKMFVQNLAMNFGMKPFDNYYVWHTIRKEIEKYKTPLQ